MTDSTAGAGAPLGTPDSDPTQALQRCLALHNEALWLLGQIGGRFPDLKKHARATFTTQRKARDHVRSALAAEDVPPPPPAYDIEQPSDTASAKQLVRSAIDRQLAAYLVLIGLVTPAERARWLHAMRTGARAQIDWSARPVAFPGLD